MTPTTSHLQPPEPNTFLGLGILLAGYFIVYWISLWGLLKRQDLDVNHKILWFLVITMMPVIGLITMWCQLPPPGGSPPPSRPE